MVPNHARYQLRYTPMQLFYYNYEMPPCQEKSPCICLSREKYTAMQGGDTVERLKIYAASAVFLFLTAAKLLFPDTAAAVRAEVHSIIDHNDDYTEMVQTLGRSLAESSWGNKLVAALGMDRGETEQKQETVPAETAEPETELEPEPESTPLPTAEEPEISAAEEAFLQQQAKFEGAVIPANVRTDRPELPFAYSAPVSGMESSGFGYRVHPIDGELSFHYGTDFAANSGDDVTAFADGYVYAAGTSEGYGNYLILTHEGGFSTIYAHLSSINVSEGEMVSRGQLIGAVGQTGKATGPHLHFELLCSDIYLNPESYL